MTSFRRSGRRPKDRSQRPRSIARLQREVVAHEAIEGVAIGLLPEGELHRPPVVLIELRLQLVIETHEDVVADEVGLGELLAGRVHALEDELRVVLAASESDIDHQELSQAQTEWCQVALTFVDPCRKELEVVIDAMRVIWR